MTTTMHWRVIPDCVAIALHTDVSPSDGEWDAYIADVAQQVQTLKGILVYAQSAGPTAPQRARVNAAYDAASVKMRTAIMSGSRFVRGVVTAMSWTLADNIKSFSTKEFEPACRFLELSDEDQLKAKVVLKQLARTAGIAIEAFADESGQFNRKYGR